MAARRYEFDKLSAKVTEGLSNVFGAGDLVESTEGYLGRVHLLIVSPKLNGKNHSEKQHFVWDILKAELGKTAEGVSVVIVYGTDELR